MDGIQILVAQTMSQLQVSCVLTTWKLPQLQSLRNWSRSLPEYILPQPQKAKSHIWGIGGPSLASFISWSMISTPPPDKDMFVFFKHVKVKVQWYYVGKPKKETRLRITCMSKSQINCGEDRQNLVGYFFHFSHSVQYKLWTEKHLSTEKNIFVTANIYRQSCIRSCT